MNLKLTLLRVFGDIFTAIVLTVMVWYACATAGMIGLTTMAEMKHVDTSAWRAFAIWLKLSTTSFPLAKDRHSAHRRAAFDLYYDTLHCGEWLRSDHKLLKFTFACTLRYYHIRPDGLSLIKEYGQPQWFVQPCQAIATTSGVWLAKKGRHLSSLLVSWDKLLWTNE